jgi:hypothetical protein
MMRQYIDSIRARLVREMAANTAITGPFVKAIALTNAIANIRRPAIDKHSRRTTMISAMFLAHERGANRSPPQ